MSVAKPGSAKKTRLPLSTESSLNEGGHAMQLRALLGALLFILPGCTYRPEEVADPRSISLQSAVFEVADTLAATRARTKDRDKVGLYVDEAVVSFNVAAKSTESTGLKLGASAPAGFVPLNASADYSLVGEGSRGNTVTITFKNIASLGKSAGAPKQVMGGEKPAQKNAQAPAPGALISPTPVVVIMDNKVGDPAEFKKRLEEEFKKPPSK